MRSGIYRKGHADSKTILTVASERGLWLNTFLPHSLSRLRPAQNGGFQRDAAASGRRSEFAVLNRGLRGFVAADAKQKTLLFLEAGFFEIFSYITSACQIVVLTWGLPARLAPLSGS